MSSLSLDTRLTELGYERRWTLYKLLVPVFFLMSMFLFATFILLKTGIGVWGVNIPVAWGFAIINFVWWVGIGHAGTFISAILLLMRQDWRNSINRLAESMTLFAVACAGLFPLLHLGRPWYFYWLLPYPNDMNLFPQYRSPLVWDAFAVMTYASVSLLFWYIGLIPDLAAARDKTKSKIKSVIFGIMSLGWSGTASEWAGWKRLTWLLALLATPLVISVHSIVSLDFAVAKLPGWHSPFFPPYFVSGAIYSGFAMVIVILLWLRKEFSLEDLITDLHLEKCARYLMISGTFLCYCYALEFFTVWLGQEHYEMKNIKHEFMGPKAVLFWLMIFCNVVSMQVLWVKKWRKNHKILFAVSLCVLLGMWLERYVIVVTTLSDTFLPAMKAGYRGTRWDWAILVGTFGVFAFGMICVLRFLPFIPISEIKEERHK
ncbi:MAG: NrfD/PsrC family molybdoenzyme membrane anchor subunit [Bacteriovoracaceae bacterium]